MPTYATQTDYENFTGQPWAGTVDALAGLLGRAENDIDAYMFPNRPYALAGPPARKVDPSTLTTADAAGLSRATCAQAEYRLAMGEDWFVQAQRDSVKGPDFTVTGKLPRIGPKVRDELRLIGLFKAMGRSKP